jgi:hypothetical protein
MHIISKRKKVAKKENESMWITEAVSHIDPSNNNNND